MKTPAFPDSMLDMMAHKFRTLSNPTRLAILRSLLESEKSVGKIVGRLDWDRRTSRNT